VYLIIDRQNIRTLPGARIKLQGVTTPEADLIYRGDWVDNAVYNVYDLVLEGGHVFICDVGHKSTLDTTPGTGVDWQKYWTAWVFSASKLDGDMLPIDFVPTNYTRDDSIPEATDLTHLAAHLKGIDNALAGVSGSTQWKNGVPTHNDLPTSGNTLGDIRYVADDGPNGWAVYRCIAVTGRVDDQWDKLYDTIDAGTLD
jgi:hypothetical protein